jgi:pimeloyl-ACP methyl ester carboxylesterase
MVACRRTQDAGQTPPVPLASLVGQEREVAAVCALLRRDDVRLLTLIGPGGVGKTRLGPAAATALAEDFDDGIWFIPLDPISDPALVAPTIRAIVGLRQIGDRPLAERPCRWVSIDEAETDWADRFAADHPVMPAGGGEVEDRWRRGPARRTD